MALSLEQKREKVYAALRARSRDSLFAPYCNIVATFDDSVIVERESKLFRLPYEISAKGDVTLGKDEPCEISYTKVGEAVGDGFLVGPVGGAEGAEPDGSAWHVVVIEAGMSQNRRRYKAPVLEAAVPKYEGAQVYWNHRKPDESPMRDPRDQAGIIDGVRGAVLESKGASPRFAIVGTLKATDPQLRTRLLEAHKAGTLSRQYGLSHAASLKTQVVREGKDTFSDVLEVGEVESVDVVGKPAAGGRFVRAVEQKDAIDREITMFEKMLEALKAKRPDLFAKLPANPTEADVTQAYEALLATPPPAAAAAPAAGAAPAAAGTPAVATATEARQPAAPAQDPTMRELVIDRAFEGRTLPEKVKARVTAELMARPGPLTITEARTAIDGWVADVAPLLDKSGGTGLGVVQVTKDAGDTALEALDGFFLRKPVNGQQFTSIREAYIHITGDTGFTGQVRNARNLRQFTRLFEARNEWAAEALTTASLGEIFGDSIRRAMVANYREPGYLDDWRKITSDITSIADFRTNRRMRFGGYGDLATVAEAGAYGALTSPTDEEATFSISKKGGTETITLEMIANDDVGVISRIPQRLAKAAKRTLYKAVFDPLRTNANIYTGTALALAGQNNISTVALSAAEISIARQRMAEQDPYGQGAGVEPMNLFPKHLLVPAELEEIGWRLTSIPMAPETSKAATEPNYSRARVGLDSLIVLPYWTDANNWWLVSDPTDVPTIEVGFFQGRQEPELFVADNPTVGSMFTNDQILYKIRFIFGVVVQDFRGFYGGIVV